MRKRLQGIEQQSDMTYLTSYKDGGYSFKNRMSLRIGHGSREPMGQGGGSEDGEKWLDISDGGSNRIH